MRVRGAAVSTTPGKYFLSLFLLSLCTLPALLRLRHGLLLPSPFT